MAGISIEAEAFQNLGGFRVITAKKASGQAVIGIEGGSPPTLTTTLDLAAAGVPPGFYQLRVFYVDETDGLATMSVAADGLALGGWTYDGVAGVQKSPGKPTGAFAQPGNFRSITLATTFTVDADTTLAFTGTRQGKEEALIDRIELIAVVPGNRAPTDITLTSATVAENASGAIIGTVTVTDPDAGDTVTVTVNDSRFQVVRGELRLKSGSSLDFETASTVPLLLTATDSGGLSRTETFTVTVGNVNERPTAITLLNARIDENTPGGIVGTVDVSDPEGNVAQVTVNDARFVVEAGRLQLRPDVSLDHETASILNLTLTATDAGGLTRSEVFAVVVTNVNEAPSDIRLVNARVNENLRGGAVSMIAVTDPDMGDSATVTVDDPRFTVVDGRLELRPGVSLDFEATPTVDVVLTATDAGGLTRSQTVTVLVTDLNEAPTAITLAATELGGGVAGAVVGDVTVVDPDAGDSVTVTVDDPRFEVVGGVLRLRAGVSVNPVSEPEIALVLTATDAAGAVLTRAVDLAVINPPPVFTAGPVAATVAENTRTVGTYAATDPNGVVPVLSIVGGADRALFTIDAAGQLAFIAAPDFEAPGDAGRNNVYDVTVGASDGVTTVTRAVAVTVADTRETFATYRIEAEAFTGVNVGRNWATEAAPVGSGGTIITLGTGRSGLITADLGAFGVPAGRYELTIRYLDETDGVSTAAAAINGVTIGSWAFDGIAGTQVIPGGRTGNSTQEGNLRTITFPVGFDVAAGSVLTLSGTQAGAESVRIDVVELRALDTPNRIPTEIRRTGAPVAENAAGAVVGTLSVIDPDAADSHTFTVDDQRFEVVGNTLRLKAGIALDFEASPTVALTVTATDRGGLSVAQPLTISVADVNEAPTDILLVRPAVQANFAGAGVSALQVVDPDLGDTHTIAISDNRFVMVNGFLRLRGNVTLNSTTEPTIALTVTATDADGLSVVRDFIIRVGNKPISVGLANSRVDEARPGAVIGTLQTNDIDAGDTFTYRVSDTRFEVVGASLKLKEGVSLDFEAQATVTLDVTTTDSIGLVRTNAVTIIIADVNEAPTAIALGGGTVAENARRTTVGTLSGTDPDAGDTITFTSNDTRFEVVNNTTLRMTEGFFFDFEASPTTTVALTATDADGLSFVTSVTVTILDVNEAPEFRTAPASIMVQEGVLAVQTLTAFDPDAGAVLRFTITGGADAAAFTLDAVTGALVFATAPDFEAPADVGADNTYDVEVTLSDGAFSLVRDLEVRVADRVEDGQTTPFSTKINFQPATSEAPAGYLADTGQAYSNTVGYGWVTEASLLDGVAGTIADAIAPYGFAMNDRGTRDVDTRLTTYAHFEFPGAPDTSAKSWAWEHALPNGSYVITVSIGDTGGANDSFNVLNIEGQAVMTPFTPTATLKSSLITVVVEVTDGRLTLDSIGGDNTEIQYIEIEALADRTPGDGLPAADGYSSFVGAVATASGQPAVALGQAVNVDPRASFAVDIALVGAGDGVDGASITAETVRLYDTRTGLQVAGSANTSAGGDVLVFTPAAALAENTSYTFVIDGVTDANDVAFLPFSATFATGLTPTSGSQQAAFESTTMDVGFNFYTSLVVSPDGGRLYATSFGGTISRWDIDPATGVLSNEQVLSDPALVGRALIGAVFDPNDPNTLWISNNDPLYEGQAEDFTGKITKVNIDTGEAFTATVEDYIVGLPRSIRDHLANSLTFRADPVTGEQKLYMTMGSNTAVGAPDPAWGFREERLLSAALLEIDPYRDTSAGPIDVQTQDPNVTLPPGAGAQVGYYNPFAPNAPVQIYASGIRNAYDLVWHSNGNLYTAVNGSAAGGNTPDDPNTPQNEALFGVVTQNDYLFKVLEGFYYGHPNPTRGEYILNGGDPTAGQDPGEVLAYPDGVTPPANYGGFAYDFSRNRSPNGTIEYMSGLFGGSLQGSLLVVEYSGGNDIVVLKLDANGNVITSDAISDKFGNIITLDDPIDLIEDRTSGRIYVATLGNGGITLLTPTAFDPDSAPRNVVLQAETAVLGGAPKIAVNQPNFTGSGFVDFTTAAGQSITWNFEVTEAGIYEIGWRYGLSSTQNNVDGRALAITVNGVASGGLPFLPTGPNFRTWGLESKQVALQIGTNTVTISTIGDSGANIDYFFRSPIPVVAVNTVPTITGAFADRSVVAGAPFSFVLDGVVIDDLDPRDEVAVIARLADGSPLPAFLSFESGTTTFSAGANAIPGLYEIELVASDGEAESTGSVRFALEVVANPLAGDIDRDGIANATDTDDDGDGVSDGRDPFFADATNGTTTPISPGRVLRFDFEDRPFGAQPGWGAGLTGFTTAGNRTPEALGFNSPNLTISGGALRINDVGTGDISNDLLTYGAQVGVEPNARFVRISTTFENPYGTQTLDRLSNFGLTIGSGDSDTYFKLVLQSDGAGRAFIRTEAESAGIRQTGLGKDYKADQLTLGFADVGDEATFTLLLDTLTGTVTSFWSIETASGIVNGQGDTLTLTGALLAAIRGDATLQGGVESSLAVGVSASAFRGTPYDVAVLDLTIEGLVADPDITLVSLDGPLAGERVVFNYIDAPLANSPSLRLFKTTGTVRITNDGVDNLELSSLTLEGPFKFLDATDAAGPITLGIGESRDIEIGFDRVQYEPELEADIFTGRLRVVSNDPETPVVNAELAGFWQGVPEGGEEPDFNEIMEVFGYGTRAFTNVFDNFDIYEAAGPDEVLSTYWQLATGYTEVTVTQIAAYHDAAISQLFIHAPGDKDARVSLMTQDAEWNQSFYPEDSRGGPTSTVFSEIVIPDAWLGDEAFGFRIAALSSDPTLNKEGPGRGPEGAQRGHFLRFFELKEADGTVVADTYILSNDISGINYDYQDSVYVIRGITPADLPLV